MFFPIGYGADPSGAQDSSDAILNAVADALMVENDGHQLLPGVSDLGGVIIDLQGVSFKIGKPIRLPPGAGNLVVILLQSHFFYFFKYFRLRIIYTVY